MPRRPRLHVPGGFCHVTLRSNHRRDIFFRPEDRQQLDTIAGEVIERFKSRLHAYCWMTNDIHALVQVRDTPLGTLIRRIAGRYARTVQRRFQTTGHLFERRYPALLVDARTRAPPLGEVTVPPCIAGRPIHWAQGATPSRSSSACTLRAVCTPPP